MQIWNTGRPWDVQLDDQTDFDKPTKMSPATRCTLAAMVLVLLVPLSAFVSIAGHGFGPCGPANFAGLFGCFGFLVCIPGAVVLGIVALALHAKERRTTPQERAHGPKGRTNWPLVCAVVGIPVGLILLSILVGMFIRR
ncbi:MAG TPA: hypothetical protein VNV60_05505 [Holophagaceae bacterium]|jgi:hypothetical protein|nr:hypothetical protein [Holophagaceae bacterium]